MQNKVSKMLRAVSGMVEKFKATSQERQRLIEARQSYFQIQEEEEIRDRQKQIAENTKQISEGQEQIRALIPAIKASLDQVPGLKEKLEQQCERFEKSCFSVASELEKVEARRADFELRVNEILEMSIDMMKGGRERSEEEFNLTKDPNEIGDCRNT